MPKATHSAEYLLNQLGELSHELSSRSLQGQGHFDKPLQIVNNVMGFHVGVLYKIANAIENDLILEVVGVCSSEHQRPDLEEGSKICLDINNPPAEFINEVMAFKRRSVSAVNVPGWGCDIVGSIYMPESLGHGYLLAGDFFGEESDIQTYEVRACEVMCNMLSAVLMKAQFEKLASIDGLTGLMNSRAIREAFEKAFQRQKRKNSGLGAVVLADIDFFKKINDQYGHIQGDSVLQEVGMLFDSFTRKHLDVAGRYGGEEFLLIYEDSDARQVLSIVERLRQSIAGHPFKKIGPSGNPIHGESLPVTMSFGVARLQYDGVTSSKELLAIADAALYQSKEDGRNRVTLGQALASAN
ncbi:GGDEF domain-containing protein [Rhodoferax sp. GW822-FHT02A01]|uniref:GGDEF domain-containing protein n=1 Tax=Rhodoferax sp. GW822-FHT02A01 TaxID=3141537 RepID=UPI00315D7D2E